MADNRTAAVGAGAVVKVRAGSAPINAGGGTAAGGSTASSGSSGHGAGCTIVAVTGRAMAACKCATVGAGAVARAECNGCTDGVEEGCEVESTAAGGTDARDGTGTTPAERATLAAHDEVNGRFLGSSGGRVELETVVAVVAATVRRSMANTSSGDGGRSMPELQRGNACMSHAHKKATHGYSVHKSNQQHATFLHTAYVWVKTLSTVMRLL